MYWFILFPFLLVAQTLSAASTQSTVQWRGALKRLMHEGDLSAAVRLDSLSKVPNLYALGAVEQLQGEIIIINSKPVVSFVKDQLLQIDTTFNRKAALLVFVQTGRWKEHFIPDTVLTYGQLEALLPLTARAYGINIDEPFPFLLKGTVKSAKWHVIDWLPGDTIHTHEKHEKSGLHGIVENEEITILGFYSSKHQGIFTHHSSNMHMHLLSKDEKIAGHLDSLTLAEGTILSLPQ